MVSVKRQPFFFLLLGFNQVNVHKDNINGSLSQQPGCSHCRGHPFLDNGVTKMAVHLYTQVVVIPAATLVQTSHQLGPPHLTLHTEQQTLKMALYCIRFSQLFHRNQKNAMNAWGKNTSYSVILSGSCSIQARSKTTYYSVIYLEVAQYKQGVKLPITQSFIWKLLSTVWGTNCSGHELTIAA